MKKTVCLRLQLKKNSDIRGLKNEKDATVERCVLLKFFSEKDADCCLEQDFKV